MYEPERRRRVCSNLSVCVCVCLLPDRIESAFVLLQDEYMNQKNKLLFCKYTCGFPKKVFVQAGFHLEIFVWRGGGELGKLTE